MVPLHSSPHPSLFGRNINTIRAYPSICVIIRLLPTFAVPWCPRPPVTPHTISKNKNMDRIINPLPLSVWSSSSRSLSLVPFPEACFRCLLAAARGSYPSAPLPVSKPITNIYYIHTATYIYIVRLETSSLKADYVHHISQFMTAVSCQSCLHRAHSSLSLSSIHSPIVRLSLHIDLAGQASF